MAAEPEPITEACDPVGHIVRTPGVVSGRSRIAGSRIRVSDIVIQRYFHNRPPEEIAGAEIFPSVRLADVYAALTYYHDDKEAIDAEFEEDEEFAERFALEHPDLVRRMIG